MRSLHGRQVRCLLQVSLDGDPARAGAPAEALPGLAEAVAGAPGLVLGGLMAVPPLGADPRAAFAELAGLAARLRADHPGAGWISAGMSGDLEEAVAGGATHLRVGTALLGGRPSAAPVVSEQVAPAAAGSAGTHLTRTAPLA